MENLSMGAGIRWRAARALRHLALVPLFIISAGLVPAGRGAVPSLEVTSDAFSHGGRIPATHTCDGENLPPPLAWGPVPPGTASLALLVSDEDAPGGSFIHWVAYNIPPVTRKIPAGGSGRAVLPAGSVQGRNDFGRAGYGGPCPPRGKPHRYHFTVYALDSATGVTVARDGRMLLGAMEGHILARGEIVGIYQRA
jgi:hypothetical protein